MLVSTHRLWLLAQEKNHGLAIHAGYPTAGFGWRVHEKNHGLAIHAGIDAQTLVACAMRHGLFAQDSLIRQDSVPRQTKAALAAAAAEQKSLDGVLPGKFLC